ncbi:MAG: dihydroorotate dehydrogenase electron transfer subunit [Ignavibacteria bacterium]|nr:MAG: dihydroorotate dehydrogenase electron transfer subunit [Ignavibacteria bacterium]
MFIIDSPLVEKSELQRNVFLFKIHCPEIAIVIKPGQFLNIRVTQAFSPFLRRPFSVSDVEGEYIFLLFSIFGEGTQILADKNNGETIDILGPLGKGFNLDDDYDIAVIVAGGLGAAPFPFVTRKLRQNKEIISCVGGRAINDIITYGMENVFTASEDGSVGFKGNVVELLKSKNEKLINKKIKIFGCGPTPMLKALAEYCINKDLNCEISTECVMACGFGICQGCPIESAQLKDRYKLVCKDGPVFNVKDILL